VAESTKRLGEEFSPQANILVRTTRCGQSLKLAVSLLAMAALGHQGASSYKTLAFCERIGGNTAVRVGRPIKKPFAWANGFF